MTDQLEDDIAALTRRLNEPVEIPAWCGAQWVVDGDVAVLRGANGEWLGEMPLEDYEVMCKDSRGATP